MVTSSRLTWNGVAVCALAVSIIPEKKKLRRKRRGRDLNIVWQLKLPNYSCLNYVNMTYVTLAARAGEMKSLPDFAALAARAGEKGKGKSEKIRTYNEVKERRCQAKA